MKIGHWLITGFGLGYAPVASGTFGSAGAMVIAGLVWLVLHLAGCAQGWAFHALVAVLALLACWGCVHWGAWAAEYFAKVSRKPGDPGQVVLDEFAGQWVALLGIPMASTRPLLGIAPQAFEWVLLVFAAQFFFFRLFDVIKPPPGRRLEKLHGGWGILLDDVAAGVYANVVGQVIFRVFLAL
jgi:phosphatidylglycerophosphatase A